MKKNLGEGEFFFLSLSFVLFSPHLLTLGRENYFTEFTNSNANLKTYLEVHPNSV